MRTILTTLSKEKAQKEIKIFSYVGIVLAIISLFLFWWLAIAAIPCGTRGLLLSWHKANAKVSTRYRIINTIGIVIGIISLLSYYFLEI